MSLTTVFVSKTFSQSSTDTKKATCTIQFTPPEAVSDKHCYLAVRELSAYNSTLTMNKGENLLLGCSWTQPRSVSYIDIPYLDGATTKYREEHDQLNRYIAVNKGIYSDPSYPRTLVFIPNGPHEVTFTLTISKTETIGFFENVSFFLELLPVD